LTNITTKKLKFSFSILILIALWQINYEVSQPTGRCIMTNHRLRSTKPKLTMSTSAEMLLSVTVVTSIQDSGLEIPNVIDPVA